MRRVVRIVIAVLLAYAVQATILPYFRLGGVMLDLITITLCTVGYTSGYYAGLTAGVFCALILETVGGDLPGIVSVSSVAAGVFGAWVASKMRAFSLPGMRGVEQNIKRVAPMVAAMLVSLAKEMIYLIYFYLTGMSITLPHIGRVLLAGLEVGVFSLVLMPVIAAFIRRSPEASFVGKRVRRRKAKREAAAVRSEERGKSKRGTKAGAPAKEAKNAKDTAQPKRPPETPQKEGKRPKGKGPSLGDLVRMPTEGGTDT